MPLSFMNDTVAVKRAPLSNKNGMEFRDWEHATSSTIYNVQVTSQATMRDYDGRLEQLTDRYTLRARYDADIRKGDRVIWNDAEFEIEGEVLHTKSPTGRVSSTRCTIVRWEG